MVRTGETRSRHMHKSPLNLGINIQTNDSRTELTQTNVKDIFSDMSELDLKKFIKPPSFHFKQMTIMSDTLKYCSFLIY